MPAIKKSARLTIKPAKQETVINTPRVGSPYALTSGQLTENVVYHNPKMGLTTRDTNSPDQASKATIGDVLKSITVLAAMAEDNLSGDEPGRGKVTEEEEPWWKVLVERRNGRTSKSKQGGHTVGKSHSNDANNVIAKGTIIVISAKDDGHVNNGANTIDTTNATNKKNKGRKHRKGKKTGVPQDEMGGEDVVGGPVEITEETSVKDQSLIVTTEAPGAAEAAIPPVPDKDDIGDDRAGARRLRSDSISFIRQRTASRTASLSSRSSIRMSSPASGTGEKSATSTMTSSTIPSDRRSESRDSINEMRKRIQVDGTGSDLDHLFVRAADQLQTDNTPPCSLISDTSSTSTESPPRPASKDSIEDMRERVQLHGTGSKLDHLFLKAADQLESENSANTSPARVSSPQSTTSSCKRAAALNPLAQVFVPSIIPIKEETAVKVGKATPKLEEPVYLCRFCQEPLRDSDPGTMLCNGCGPFSRTRYCTMDCMFLDFNDHWTICNEKRMSFPVRFALPSSGKRDFIPAIHDRYGFNSAARLRQQLWSMHRHQECDYALFSDRIPWMDTGIPILATAPTRVISLPKGGGTKDILNRLLNVAFADHYQPAILLLLFRMIRKGLNQAGYWNPDTAEDLIFQFGAEFGINARFAAPTDPDLAREWYGRRGLERLVKAMEDANPVLNDWRRDRSLKH